MPDTHIARQAKIAPACARAQDKLPLRWFQSYIDDVDDPRLQRLSGELFKLRQNLLCIAAKHGGKYPPVEDMAYTLHLSVARLTEMRDQLVKAGLDDIDGPTAWDRRQYKSDGSNDRVQRFRDRQRQQDQEDNDPSDRHSDVIGNGSVTLHETGPEAEAEAEAEAEKKESCRVADATPTLALVADEGQASQPQGSGSIANASSPAKGYASTARAERRAYPEDFERWWKSYPKTPVMSKTEAVAQWRKLSVEDKDRAAKALPDYKAFLRSKPDHPVVHACRFLSQRRFDGFTEAAAKPMVVVPAHGEVITEQHDVAGSEKIGRIFLRGDTPEHDAWCISVRHLGQISPPSHWHGGWHFESRWPPGHAKSSAPATATPATPDNERRTVA